MFTYFEKNHTIISERTRDIKCIFSSIFRYTLYFNKPKFWQNATQICDSPFTYMTLICLPFQMKSMKSSTVNSEIIA